VLRLWLDNHLSPALARSLREQGHDVVALQEEPRPVRDLPDELLLVEASRRGRTIVTYNVRDFVHLHRAFLASGRPHSGIVVVSSRAIRQDDIGGQMRALAGFFEEHAGVADFRDRLAWATPLQR